MKRPKKTYLVDEKNIETIAYADKPEEDLFKGESILEAANKVLDFEEFKRQQEEAIKNFNENNFDKNKRKAKNSEKDIFNSIKKSIQEKDKAAQIAAKKISKKYKNIRFRWWKTIKKPKICKNCIWNAKNRSLKCCFCRRNPW